MKLNKFLATSVAILALTSQSVWAQAPVGGSGVAVGAPLAIEAGIGGIALSSIVIGAVIATVVVAAVNDSGSTTN